MVVELLVTFVGHVAIDGHERDIVCPKAILLLDALILYIGLQSGFKCIVFN